jgi:hypothetical protein
MPSALADAAFEVLAPDELRSVAAYLESPDFEQLALQMAIAFIRGREDIRLAVREQLREGLRVRCALAPGPLLPVTDAIQDALFEASGQAFAGSGPISAVRLAEAAHVAAMAARNGRLLARIGPLAEIHERGQRLRSQVAALHGELRLPHTGATRTVPWDNLYVLPELERQREQDPPPPEIEELSWPGRLTVVLGDPGAGKSSLATKVAHEVASRLGGEQVPFLVVLRDYADGLRAGERSLAEHLAAVSRAPYNVEMTGDAIEYLLLNGRAMVILDGLDELTNVALRQRLVDLVRGFTSLYPLTPVLVTSRRIGYSQVPLGQEFQTCLIAPFDKDRVESYARNWFGLNEMLAEPERAQLCEAFLHESEPIDDLRCNPLLLSLLCSMYATEQYIPRNRAQVYERCAIMVFDRWDSMRGIAVPVEFEGKVRGAIQELAWRMFTGQGTELPRRKVLSIISGYLRARRFDEDEARSLAEEFLAFCAGRAWVLTEVGATETEPIYGFAHRTFLEYFAAEHLVRHHPTPEQVWQVLEPKLADASWEVVAQLAVQLLERNVEDGAEEVLGRALDTQFADPLGTAFAARVGGQVGLSPLTLGRMVTAAVALVRQWPLAERVRFWVDHRVFTQMSVSDGPLYTLMYRSLRGNIPYIQKALAAELGELAADRDDIGVYLLQSLDRSHRADDARPWAEVKREVSERFASELADWDDRYPWYEVFESMEHPERIDAVYDRFGAQAFYSSDCRLGSASFPAACSMIAVPDIAEPGHLAFPEAARRLRARLLATPTPWLPAWHWYEQFPAEESARWQMRQVLDHFWPDSGEDLATLLVVFLPYLETMREKGIPLPAQVVLREGLDFPADCEAFLNKWEAGEIKVIG